MDQSVESSRGPALECLGALQGNRMCNPITLHSPPRESTTISRNLTEEEDPAGRPHSRNRLQTGGNLHHFPAISSSSRPAPLPLRSNR